MLESRIGTAILIVLLLFELALLSASIPGHPLHVDEAWLGEQAWLLSRDGYAHSNLFLELDHQNEHIVLYHHLFIQLSALLFTWLGFGIDTMRLLPIASGGVLLVLIWLLQRRIRQLPAAHACTAMLGLLLMPLSFVFFKVARPEMTLAMFGFASFVALAYHPGERRLDGWTIRRSDRQRRTDALFQPSVQPSLPFASGLLAGAAMLTHLNGAIFIAAGFVVLLLDRRWRDAMLFALAAVIAFSPFIIDVITHYSIFTEQISNPQLGNKATFSPLTPIMNLLGEHKRLFHQPPIIVASLAFLAGLAASAGDRSDHTGRLLRRYTILAMVALGMLMEDKSMRYAACFGPFWAVVVADGLRSLAWRRLPWRGVVGATLLLLFVYGVWYQIDDIAADDNTIAINRQIGEHIPTGSRVVAPVELAMEQVQRLDIVALHYYRLQSDSITPASLEHFCRRYNIDHVVFYTSGEWNDERIVLHEMSAQLYRRFELEAQSDHFEVWSVR